MPSTRRQRKRARAAAPPPAITVVTPSLPERHAMLAEACASVAAQTWKPAAHLIAVDYNQDGPGALLNRLIRSSETEWLSILADDDLYDPNHLETLAAHSGEADIVLSWSRIEGEEQEQYRGKFRPTDLLDRKDTGMRGCFLFRKSLWKRLGGWDENEPLEDWRFLCRAVIHDARLVPVYRETWTYRFHDTNCSHLYASGAPLPHLTT